MPKQSEPGFGTAKVKPVWTVRATVVGIAELNSEIVRDGVDDAYGFVFVTPAYLREAIARSPGHATPALYGLQFDRGDIDVATIENELVNVVPPHYTYEFHVTSRVTSEVELAIKPESIALGAFGLIAALACLVLALQAISRLLRAGDEDRQVLRALGASPTMNDADGLVGVFASVFLGSLVATAVAVSAFAAVATRPGAPGVSRPRGFDRLDGAGSRPGRSGGRV